MVQLLWSICDEMIDLYFPIVDGSGPSRPNKCRECPIDSHPGKLGVHAAARALQQLARSAFDIRRAQPPRHPVLR
jgi:hypothetical protein